MLSLFCRPTSNLVVCSAVVPQEHAADPAKGWRAKDCAVYLVMAVTVKGKTGELGATTTNRLVNIGDFFTQQVGASCTAAGAVGAQQRINAAVHHYVCCLHHKV